jgi:arylsulfatase A-like enzyme
MNLQTTWTKRLALLQAALFLVMSLPVFTLRAAAQEKKPNILFIMTDDVGWMDLGSYGGGADRGALTPNLDRLAAEGMRFTQYYAQPTCSLGRVSVITGRQPFRAGLLGVIVPGDPNGLSADEVTLPQYLKRAGYHTMQTGKWHMGDKPKFYPTAHGFDEMHYMLPYYGNVYTYDDPNYYVDFPFNNKVWMNSWNKMNLFMWEQNPGGAPHKMPVCSEGTNSIPVGYAPPCGEMRVGEFKTTSLAYVDKWQADFVSKWIKDHAHDSAPFFIYLNFMRMHNPTTVPYDMKGTSPGKYPYTDGLQMLDADSGEVVQALRDAGIARNTIVVWTTDNGAWIDTCPDCGNTPWRGEKSSAFEGGFKVPAIAWWPGTIPAGSVNHDMFSSMDWFPSFAKLAGLPVPPRHWRDNAGAPIVFDGIEQVDSLTGKGPGKRQVFEYINAGQGFAGVRLGRFKIMFNSHDSWLGINQNMTVPAVYDLLIDPFEQHDIMFSGAAPMRDAMKTSPGRWLGHDHGWIFGVANKVVIDFFDEMKHYPNRWEPPAGELLYQTIQPLPNGVLPFGTISKGAPGGRIPTEEMILIRPADSGSPD